MSKLQAACELIRVARMLIEERSKDYSGGDRDDLGDIAKDLGTILFTLESFDD